MANYTAAYTSGKGIWVGILALELKPMIFLAQKGNPSYGLFYLNK